MSFENTHLWAADVIKDKISAEVLQELIINNIDYYNIGAVFPDTSTMDDLMDQGIKMGIKMVEAAFDYYRGKISLHLCKNTVFGGNLITGRIHKTMADIKFSIDI